MEKQVLRELDLLLKAYEMAELTDFISDDETDFYMEETVFTFDEVSEIQKKYDGWGMDYINEKIRSVLNDNINN